MRKQNYTTDNLRKILQVITDGEKPLYEIFNNESVGRILSGVTLINTWYQGRFSKRSLQIKCDDISQGEDLARAFCLNGNHFNDKYQEAISGDGQEARRIRTLHSSSLISLLCFYGISKTKPLHLDFEGRHVVFTESTFEVKNPVGTDMEGHTHESNVDVVLTGKDIATHKTVILFLESKFSEYLNWGCYSGISHSVYGTVYSQLTKGKYLERMGLKYKDDPDNKGYHGLFSVKGRTQHYAGGIKQMVSHYLGVRNAAEKESYRDCDIYLGTILYQFPDTIDTDGKKFNDYNKIYSILANGLNALSKSKVRVLNQCLTYHDVFKTYELDDSVRSFYSL